MKNIKSIIDTVNTYIKIAIPYIVIVILIYINIKQCTNNSITQKTNDHNIEVLTDSIKTYKTLSGDIEVEKKILIGDISLLKKTNDSLYNKLNDMQVKNPSQVIYIKNDVEYETHDTTYIINNTDTTHLFNFSNKWRELSGEVSVHDTLFNLTFNKDIVHLDYTIAVSDGKAYVTSSNPYVKFNNIEGITVPTPKTKHWCIGPVIGVGVNTDLNIRPFVGFGISYSLFSW